MDGLAEAVIREDGAAARAAVEALLLPRTDGALDGHSASSGAVKRAAGRKSAKQALPNLPEEWAAVAGALLDTGAAPLERTLKACAAMNRAAEDAGAWAVPSLLLLVRHLVAQAKRDPRRASDAPRIVNKALAVCLGDRSAPEEHGRMRGAAGVAAALLRLYFALGQPWVCANVLRALGAAARTSPGASALLGALRGEPFDARSLALFAPGHVASLAHSVGRFCVLGGRHDEALCALLLAARLAHSRPGCMRRLAPTLVPLLLLGHCDRRPCDALLAQCPSHVHSLFGSLRLGDVQAYLNALSTHAKALLADGTLMLWEALVPLAVLRLVRRVWATAGRCPDAGVAPSRVPIPLLAALSGVPLDRVCVFLAHLVADRRIRGYVSESHSMLVLSAGAPFG